MSFGDPKYNELAYTLDTSSLNNYPQYQKRGLYISSASYSVQNITYNNSNNNYVIQSGGSDLLNMEIDKWTPEVLSGIVNYRSAKDIEKKGIFVPGKLYKFAPCASYEYDPYNTWLYPVRWNTVTTSTPIHENLGSTITPVKNPFEGVSSQELSFLCLKTEPIKEKQYTCMIDDSGKIKILDRKWRTTFLIDEKVFCYDWFEDEAIARLHKGHTSAYDYTYTVPFPSTTYSYTTNTISGITTPSTTSTSGGGGIATTGITLSPSSIGVSMQGKLTPVPAKKKDERRLSDSKAFILV